MDWMLAGVCGAIGFGLGLVVGAYGLAAVFTYAWGRAVMGRPIKKGE